jgi:hypothetical protein
MPPKGKAPASDAATEGVQTRSKSTQPNILRDSSEEALTSIIQGDNNQHSSGTDPEGDGVGIDSEEEVAEVERRRAQVHRLEEEVKRQEAIVRRKKAAQTRTTELEALDRKAYLLEGQLQRQEHINDDSYEDQTNKRRRANTEGDRYQEP